MKFRAGAGEEPPRKSSWRKSSWRSVLQAGGRDAEETVMMETIVAKQGWQGSYENGYKRLNMMISTLVAKHGWQDPMQQGRNRGESKSAISWLAWTSEVTLTDEAMQQGCNKSAI